MGHVLCSGTQVEDGKNLGAGVDDQPEPEHILREAKPGAQFIQLEVWKLQMTAGPLVQGLSMLASARQPGGDGGLTVAEDPLGCGRVQSFSECRQHDCDLLGRGFQTIQRGMTARAERGVTGLATKRLDLLGMAMLAIPNQSVDVSVSDSEVWALLVETGKAFCVHRFGAPRRLFTSHQGRTGAGAGLTPEEERRQMRQSSGVRGLRRRWTRVRLLPACEGEG